MRISDVAVYAGRPEGAEELFTFSLREPAQTDQYMVREMAGLDSEELIPKFYGFGKNSKDKFYDFSMKPRTVVMRLVLNPRFALDESYSDVRDHLYRSISAVRTGIVVLHFNYVGTTVARIFGFITKFEVPYFTPLPEVQISFRCDDPLFRAINPVTLDPPELKTTNPIVIGDALSTAPHGFAMRLTFKANTTSFTVQDASVNPEWTFKILPTGGFLVGDVLNFSSDYSDKYLYVVRGATRIYLVDKIQPDSVWPIIFPGGSTFYFLDIASFNWNFLEYYPAYWGL